MRSREQKFHDSGWRDGVTDGHWWQAKISEEPGPLGVNGGRVIKMAVCNSAEWNHKEVIFNYSGGVDIDNAPPELIQKIISAI